MGSVQGSFTVLVIDDDPTMRELVVAFLGKVGIETVTASDGLRGLDCVRERDDISAIVLDVMMPGMDGYEVLGILKDDDATRSIPVLLLTAHANDEVDVLRSLAGGAVDHLAKPFKGRILAAKVRTMCEKHRADAGMRQRVETAETMANTDALTGLANRRAFDLALARAIGLCQRDSRPLTLLMVDVDRFKMVNDQHGHAAGDHVLVWLARILEAAKGQAFRIGGEEFCVLLEGTDVEAAEGAARELLQAVRGGQCKLSDATVLPLTVSVGIAVAGVGNDHATDGITARADAALYAAKDGGRDRHVIEPAIRTEG